MLSLDVMQVLPLFLFTQMQIHIFLFRLQSITVEENRQILSILFNYNSDMFLNKNSSSIYGFVKASR